ncbi:MAG: glycogen/starch synthase [Comamonadaceae bacterium]|nr:glycogen/starch synthase [Comamonadaceae bacterium]
MIDAPYLYDASRQPLPDGRTARDWPDNRRRFAPAGLGGGAPGRRRRSIRDWRADVVHAHDWHAGAGLRLPGARTRADGRAQRVHRSTTWPSRACSPLHDCAELGLPRRAYVAARRWSSTASCRS